MISDSLKKQCIEFFENLIMKEIDTGFVAGGAVRDWFSRRKITSDVDVWFASDADFLKAKTAMGEPEFATDDLVNYRRKGIKIQLINRVHFANPIDVLEYFDFTVSCAAVSRLDVVTHQQFFVDLCRRSLVIANLPHPRSTLSRVLKYERKGFRICPIQLNKLVKAIHKLPEKELEQPVFYVD